MTETITEPRRIDHRQALADYLAMGPQRSLVKLHQYYEATANGGPCLQTLKNWSKKHGWQKAAARHDERVAAQIAERAERVAVEKGFDQVAAFAEIIEHGAVALREFIKDPENLKKVTNAAEFGTVANALVRISQLVELLEGRPTGRLGVEHKAEPPEWMKNQIEQAEESEMIDVTTARRLEHQPDRTPDQTLN